MKAREIAESEKPGPTVGEAASAQHIARVAARLFASRGYDATSVREISEAAGVTKPTLYYHFGSKEGLAQALLNRPLESLLDHLRSQIREEPDPIVMLEGMVRGHLEFCQQDPDRSRFVYALFFGPLGSGLAAEITKFADEFDRLMGEVADRLVDAHLIDPARARAFQQAVRGVIVIHTMDHLYRGENLDAGLPCQLVRDLIKGFGTPEQGRR